MEKALAKRTLGRTGLLVTHLGYGTLAIRGSRIWGGRPVPEEQAEAMLNTVLDAGINFIDTGNDYGRSEEFIGKFISRRRKEYFIATKCGCVVVPQDGPKDLPQHVWTRENLFRGLHESLQRMKTDYVDIMLLHSPSVEQCEQGSLVEVLQEMRTQGKVRWIGCSYGQPHDLATFIRWGVFDVFQLPYSALSRRLENVITAAAKAGAGIINRGGVAKGATGVGQGEKKDVVEAWKKFDEARLDELRESGESRTAFMLRFLLSHPHIHTTSISTLVLEHLKEDLAAAAKGPLDECTYAEARKRLDAAGCLPD